MTSRELRTTFLEYFRKNGHEVVQSSSLLPEGDATLLFTNAGMVQFKGVFLKTESRDYTRAASCQKCMRAGGKHNDLENVGQTARHHTFFEMLGNFSFGDYFKTGAVRYAWEFLTEVLSIPKEKLWVTVYEEDDEAEAIWREETDVEPGRIIRMGEKDNFWSMGDTGPCGPCSEIYVDQGADTGCGRPECAVGCECDRFIEIWNLVFMQYDRDTEGALTPLPSPCIDTGMGLERLAAVMQGKKSNYDTDIFAPLIGKVEELSGVRYGADRDHDVSIRAIADHARSTAFLIADGILPSNEGRGYVLRRIIRRAARHGRFLGMTEPFIHTVCEVVVGELGTAYPELISSAGLIGRATRGEEERFFETLERGLSLLDEEVEGVKRSGGTVIPGPVAFKLYDTYGFPVDLTADIIKKDGLTVDEEGFNSEMERQRDMARRAGMGSDAAGAPLKELYNSISAEGAATEFVGYHMEAASGAIVRIIRDGAVVENAKAGDTVQIITDRTPFYGESGGQVGDTGVMTSKGATVTVTNTMRPMPGLIVHHCRIDDGGVKAGDTVELVPDTRRRAAIRRNHTATHILHAALRKTLGEHVRQAGSLVTPDGLRFDFNHFEALPPDALREIEEAANAAVLENREVRTDVLPYSEAIERGALAFFGDKYADVVRLVSIEGISAELCGGTHASRTGDIGLVKVTSDSSVAAGVRRIEALTGTGAIASIEDAERILGESTQLLKVARTDLPARIKKLVETQRELERELEGLRSSQKAGKAAGLIDRTREVHGVKVLSVRVDGSDGKDLRAMADTMRAKIKSGVVVLAAPAGPKALLLAAVTADLTKRISAGELIKRLAPTIGGKGGGKPDLAQAGGTEPGRIDEVVEDAYRIAADILEETR